MPEFHCHSVALPQASSDTGSWLKLQPSSQKKRAYGHYTLDRKRWVVTKGASQTKVFISGGTEAATVKTRAFSEWGVKSVAAGMRARVRTVVPPSLSLSFQRLLGLLKERGQDDFGEVSPTQHAFRNALELVVGAEWAVAQDVKSSPVVDSEGGITVNWRNGEKLIKLVCPAASDAQPYVYRRSPHGSYIDKENVTPAGLAAQLSWLLHDDKVERSSK